MDSYNKIFSADPISNYYNLNGLKDAILTCDVDWAPDFAVEYVLELVQSHGLKITLFATHRSQLLRTVLDGVEVGLHPDFTRGHKGKHFNRLIQDLKEVYPESIGMRSHRNFFGQNVSDLAVAAGLSYDVSTLLWNEPFCQAHTDYNGLLKFAYCWEDGIHLDTDLPHDVKALNLQTPGLKILNVHPILLYLNSPTEEHRRSVTKRYSDLTSANKKDIDSARWHKLGITDFYKSILSFIQESKIKTHLLRDVASGVLQKCQGSL